jgi:hypothetical protein
MCAREPHGAAHAYPSGPRPPRPLQWVGSAGEHVVELPRIQHVNRGEDVVTHDRRALRTSTAAFSFQTGATARARLTAAAGALREQDVEEQGLAPVPQVVAAGREQPFFCCDMGLRRRSAPEPG